MSERFNQGAAIEGKMPLGLFNSMYGFNGPWQTDQQSTKALALDGWFIKLFSLQLTQYPLILHDQVRDAVPSLWDPKALASFIEKYGTHIIVGVVIGGKDVVYVRQHQSSPATVTEVQKLMQTVADNRFLGQAYRERTVREKVNPYPHYHHSLSLLDKKDWGSFKTSGIMQDGTWDMLLYLCHRNHIMIEETNKQCLQ
jgi:hypothetical protein